MLLPWWWDAIELLETRYTRLLMTIVVVTDEQAREDGTLRQSLWTFKPVFDKNDASEILRSPDPLLLSDDWWGAHVTLSVSKRWNVSPLWLASPTTASTYAKVSCHAVRSSVAGIADLCQWQFSKWVRKRVCCKAFKCKTSEWRNSHCIEHQLSSWTVIFCPLSQVSIHFYYRCSI